MNCDQLIFEREQARAGKNWKLSDEIRGLLDKELIFIFDAPWGQQIFYLTDSYFKRKPDGMTNRKYVEHRIQKDSEAERVFDGWLFTVRNS